MIRGKKLLVDFLSLFMILVTVFISAFFGINLGFIYGLEQKLPRIIELLETSKTKTAAAYKPLFQSAPEQDHSEIFRKENVEYPFIFIVYGDSREVATYEKELLVDQIIKENPAFVLHAGDLVLHDERHQWNIFDLFDGRITDAGIPIYPVLGNHEYKLEKNTVFEGEKAPLENYFDRFKFLENRRWYSFKYGNSSFLMLDSNVDYYSGSFQYKWLMDKLGEKSSDFLFITFHHPPYTKG